MKTSFALALSTLVGTIVGAGIFSLPYVIIKSGVIPGVFYFIFFGGIVMLLHLFWGEVCLRTSGKHRIIGYAEIYLGKWGKILATGALVFVLIGVLLAYLILAGQFLHIIFSPVVPQVSSIMFSILTWGILSFFVFKGIQLISKLELFLNVALFAVILAVFIFAIPHIHLQNFSLFHSSGLFFPFGILLFSMAGWDAIPEIADLFKNKQEKKRLDNVIVWASVITVGLFLLFSFFVVGVSGTNTTQDSFGGLEQFLGKPIIMLGALFGLLAIVTSFLVLGNYLKNSLFRDFQIPYPLACAIALGLPLALFLAGFREFLTIIGIVGTVMGGVEGVLMILIFKIAKRKGDRIPEYEIRIPSFLLFLIAIILIGIVTIPFLFK